MKWVRELIGPYAGQMRQFPDHIAENLIDTGHGEYPTPEEVAGYEQWIEGDVETATLPTTETPEATLPPAMGGAKTEPAPKRKKTATRKKTSKKSR